MKKFICLKCDYDVRYLLKIGITERKSKNTIMPIVDRIYLGSLMRGIFDGDGSVYINRTSTNYNGMKKNYEYINASITTGCLTFAYEIQEVLKIFQVESTLVKDSRVECWYVKIYSKDSIKNFYKSIYRNDKLSLKRKKNLFRKMI